jgi:peptidoglycan hydrolase-like protein with peptidoglycan-binding domain
LIEQWRARAWAAYARGDSPTAHALWACADQLQEALVTDETLHLTDHWPVAPGHELTQNDWDAIKAAADEWAGRSDDGQWSPQIPAYVDIPYPGAGGRKDSGTATKQLWVIHTAECPLSTGYARSLSLWSASSTVQASWHRMSDPGTVARFVPPGRAAWHATIANRISVGYEQAGYAAFPRSTWLTVDGQASIDRLAQVIVADGVPLSSVRRLTDDEVRRALNGDTSVRGICSHAQIQPKDRTDPGAGYPWDVLLDSIKRHHPDTKTPDTPQTVWGEGDTGPDVERIQRIVGATVDGDWGPLTTAAVKAWQTLHGLEPDGLWGPLCEAASKTTIPTLTEDDMRIITDGTRTALVGAGYLATLDTPEAVDVTKALVGSPVVVGNARQYDVWVAACTQGRNVTAPTVTAEALQAAIRGALTGLIGGAK